MKIAVTGAAGRLGSLVCAELVQAGHEVVALDRADDRSNSLAVRGVDLRDGAAVRTAVAGSEVLVHLGNYTHYLQGSPEMIYGENVAMNFNVTRAAIETGVRHVIFASSVHVSSGESERAEQRFPTPPAYLPGDGNLPAIPRNSYALSKEAGEQMLRYLARTHGTSSVAIRYPLLVASRAQVPANYVRPNEWFAWLSYRDAARLVLAIVGRPLSGFRIYFPAAKQACNQLPVAENVRQFYAGVPQRRPLEELDSLVDCSTITAETGWSSED